MAIEIEHFIAKVAVGMDGDFSMIECPSELVYRDYRDSEPDWQDHERSKHGIGVYIVTGCIEYTRESMRDDGTGDGGLLFDFDYTTNWNKVRG